MEKGKTNYSKFFLIVIWITLISCSRNYLGHYKDINNSNLYNSEIEINNNSLVYTASSDMLGTVIQKEPYSVLGNTILVNFKNKDSLKSTRKSYSDNKINGVKISITSIFSNDSITPIVHVIINDSLKYLSKKNDTVFKKFKVEKITLKDAGLNFITDTTFHFSNKNKDNVFEFNLKLKKELPVLSEKGRVKYLIKRNELYVFIYDESQKKYIKTNRCYLKKEKSPPNFQASQ